MKQVSEFALACRKDPPRAQGHVIHHPQSAQCRTPRARSAELAKPLVRKASISVSAYSQCWHKYCERGYQKIFLSAISLSETASFV